MLFNLRLDLLHNDFASDAKRVIINLPWGLIGWGGVGGWGEATVKKEEEKKYIHSLYLVLSRYKGVV